MKWEKVKVKSISNQIRGVSYNPADVGVAAGDGFLPVLRANNITDSGINLKDLVFINNNCISQKQKLLKGDILIAASSGSKNIVGKAAMVNNNLDAAFGAFCKVVRPDSNKVNPKYLGYYFQSTAYRRTISELSAGANINNIRNEDIDNLEIPLPPLHVQEQIADILDKADALRRKVQELLMKYDELVDSIFYDMFGDPVKNEKGWNLKSLGVLCTSFKYGTNLKCDSTRSLNSLPVVRIPNVLDNTVNFEDLKYAVFTEKEWEEVKLREGDLLFVRTNGNPNYIGRSAVFPGGTDAAYASYLIRARLDSNSSVLPQFVQTVFSSPTYRPEVLKKATTTAGNYNINTESLKSLQVVVPPLYLQQQFLRHYQSICEQKRIAESGIRVSSTLLSTLLDKHFS
jgi:type I restriction enzyme S subunit